MPTTLTPLNECLASQIEAAGRLLASLREEYAALGTNDAEALERALAPKQAALADLAELDRERERLARAAGIPDSGPGPFAEPTPLQVEVQAGWRRLLELAAECRRQNQANGALIQAGLRHTRQIVALLGGRSPEETVAQPYGPGGEISGSRAGAGHSLGKA